MGKFKKKHLTVDAWLWDGKTEDDAEKFIKENGLPENCKWNGGGRIIIPTLKRGLKGIIIAYSGDFVVRDLNGVYTLCHSDIFFDFYESMKKNESNNQRR